MATGNVRDENKKFESDGTSSISEKIKTKQSCYLQKFQGAIRYLAIKPTQQVSSMNT